VVNISIASARARRWAARARRGYGGGKVDVRVIVDRRSNAGWAWGGGDARAEGIARVG